MGLLEGKRALVTGARKGIGRGIALTFAREGATVGVNDIVDDEVAHRTVEEVVGTFHHADVSTVAGITDAIDQFVERHGGIDILVNNAICPDLFGPFMEHDEDLWDRVMGISAKGYYFGAQHAARAMLAQGGGGRILCVSSVHADVALPEWTIYGVAKAAVRHMVKGMAVELADTGITVNAISPGLISNKLPAAGDGDGGADAPGAPVDGPPIDTEEVARFDIPSSRDGRPSDIAEAALLICSDRGSYINGTNLLVDGGLVAGGFRMDI